MNSTSKNNAHDPWLMNLHEFDLHPLTIEVCLVGHHCILFCSMCIYPCWICSSSLARETSHMHIALFTSGHSRPLHTCVTSSIVRVSMREGMPGDVNKRWVHANLVSGVFCKLLLDRSELAIAGFCLNAKTHQTCMCTHISQYTPIHKHVCTYAHKCMLTCTCSHICS